MYTSKELSKKLKENGCELESETYMYWSWTKTLTNGKWVKEWHLAKSIGKGDGDIPAYDILNDICIKYKEEFFTRDRCLGCSYEYYPETSNDHPCLGCTKEQRPSVKHTIKEILELLQLEEIKIAEYTIWENCLFNPKK